MAFDRIRIGAIGVVALALSAVLAASPASAGFYDGKDVTVIVNAGAGGGLTRTGRLFTTTMKKHLGQNTNMVIKNIAGGGGVTVSYTHLTLPTKA